MDESNDLVEYQKLDYVDYVDNALANKFSLARTINVDLTMYKQRISAIAKIYYVLELLAPPPAPTADPNEVQQYMERLNQQGRYPVLSFHEVSFDDDVELQEAQTATSVQLSGTIFRVVVGSNYETYENDKKKIKIKFNLKYTCFVGNTEIVLVKNNNEGWIPRSTI